MPESFGVHMVEIVHGSVKGTVSHTCIPYIYYGPDLWVTVDIFKQYFRILSIDKLNTNFYKTNHCSPILDLLPGIFYFVSLHFAIALHLISSTPSYIQYEHLYKSVVTAYRCKPGTFHWKF